MSFDRKESAAWALAVNTEAGKLAAEVDKALADGAQRGFPAPPGETLGFILEAGLEAQSKLAAANGKIYDEGREKLFTIDEFALKVLVRIAKLSLESYREQIMNALALEQSQQAADTERRRADIERLNAETEFRMVGVIRAKAAMEQSIIIYRRQLVAAERESLVSETLLINAQLETAKKKLEIIDSIYQVLAAEELVLAAERRRAASLELVLESQRRLAAIEKEMEPFYLAKAEARVELAAAVTKEAKVREDIEKLGYDRLALKVAEEDFAHREREANEDYEIEQAALTRARKATEIARVHLRRLLLEYSNQVRQEIISLKEQLAKDGIDFKLFIELAKLGLNIDNDVVLTDHDRGIINQELNNLLQNMWQRALDQEKTVKASAKSMTRSTHQALIGREIIHGVITAGGGAGTQEL
jgi:hypothetical protein